MHWGHKNFSPRAASNQTDALEHNRLSQIWSENDSRKPRKIRRASFGGPMGKPRRYQTAGGRGV
eukprot:7079633-Pyramimonas_sp.AAC.1